MPTCRALLADAPHWRGGCWLCLHSFSWHISLRSPPSGASVGTFLFVHICAPPGDTPLRQLGLMSHRPIRSLQFPNYLTHAIQLEPAHLHTDFAETGWERFDEWIDDSFAGVWNRIGLQCLYFGAHFLVACTYAHLQTGNVSGSFF